MAGCATKLNWSIPISPFVFNTRKLGMLSFLFLEMNNIEFTSERKA
jgi:hypothetical protein